MTWFFAASRVLIVAGKGGVGKTTLGATLGVAAAQAGIDTLLIQTSLIQTSLIQTSPVQTSPVQTSPVQGPPTSTTPVQRDSDTVADPISRMFGVAPLGHAPSDLLDRSTVSGRLRGCTLSADQALLDYLEFHGLDRFAKRGMPSGSRALEMLTAAIPGIRDLLLLGKIRQLEASNVAQWIVVDAPSSGHAITFLRSASGLAETGSGPIAEQARLASEFLLDADRCQVALVTLAEETPITETIETAFEIEEQLGVKLAPVLVNERWPDLVGLEEAARRGDGRRVEVRRRRAAAELRLGRVRAQATEITRLHTELPLPTLELPPIGLIEPLGEALDSRGGLGTRPDLEDLRTLASWVRPERLRNTAHSEPDPAGVTATGAPTTETPGTGALEVVAGSSRSRLGSAGPNSPIRAARVIICLGPGGVGKTTTAAALAMAAAANGRRVALITVDPARRLADALGLETLGHQPELLDGPWSSAYPDHNGSLSACMLDTRLSFEQIIREQADSAAQADRIIGHRLFEQLTTSLSGTHEYLAMDQLWHLHEHDDFDLVVVDTPPAQNAIGLLESAGRLVRFIDHPLYRGVLAPKSRLGRVAAVAARGAVTVVGRLIGMGLVEEVGDFFSALGEMDAGFRQRAAEIETLLRSDQVDYVLVATPRVGALEQTLALAEHVPATSDPAPGRRQQQWLLWNRCTPFGFTRPTRAKPARTTGPTDSVDRSPGPNGQSPAVDEDPAAVNLRQIERMAEEERRLMELWTNRMDAAVLGALEERPRTVSSISGVWDLARSFVD